MLQRLTVVFLFIVITLTARSQSISGYVYDENNTPVAFANVYIKNIAYGTTTDAQGKYFYQFTDPGVYNLIISAVGFKTTEVQLIMRNNENQVKNIWIETDAAEMEELVVAAKRRDPAYEIISNAIKAKNKWKRQFNSSTCEVYIKAKEVISEKEKNKRQKAKEQEKIEEQNKSEVEILDDESNSGDAEQAAQKIAGSMNMVETQLTRHWQAPNKVKEIRYAYKKYGSDYGLYFTNTVQQSFNFYDNLMNIENLNELPLVSPLHATSVLTYKFNLIESKFVGDKQEFKIKVTPRKKGNASWEGYIWILDKDFCITRIDLSIEKGGLYIYDEFNVKQEYEFIQDTISVIKRQEFDYISKTGKQKFHGNTIVKYSDYKINPVFEKRFFSNELAVTTDSAYTKDSSYWEKIRPEPLTKEEQDYQRIRDSIYTHLHSDAYLDSVDSVYNKITLLDIAWEGIGFSNRKKMQYWNVSSLASLINPFEIGGLRLGPGGTYFKKWKNQKYLWSYGGLDIGLRNKDLKGNIGGRFRYAPKHFGLLGFTVGRVFDNVVQNDALTNLFMRNNWIEKSMLTIYHRRELFNGFFVGTNFYFADRRPISKYKFGDLTSNWFNGNPTLEFSRYQSTIIEIGASYTPFQKYMTEPNRKIILGSKWPTVGFTYRKGINGLFGSDINFDYLEGYITQSFKLGTMGTSTYKIQSGKFLNTSGLRYVDNKIFPRGDKWFFASLMMSMQIQDTTLTAKDLYLEAHYAHHFNGAIINYIPLVKKLQLHVAAGASALYIKESNYMYGEVFVGMERAFKAQRARYRIGIYFVAAHSNYKPITPRIKFAFNRYSLRNQTWGY